MLKSFQSIKVHLGFKRNPCLGGVLKKKIGHGCLWYFICPPPKKKKILAKISTSISGFFPIQLMFPIFFYENQPGFGNSTGENLCENGFSDSRLIFQHGDLFYSISPIYLSTNFLHTVGCYRVPWRKFIRGLIFKINWRWYISASLDVNWECNLTISITQRSWHLVTAMESTVWG